MESPAANPYPGPRPFMAGENLYGRDQEVTRLFYLLSAERIVVLHSPSGAGKSSLLNAGLVPRLRAERFYPWPTIRLSQPAANGGNRFVWSAIASMEEALPGGLRRPAGELAGLSLAEYVAGRPRRPGAPASVVLVFDQFEEILTLDPLDLDAKREFFGQLGEALENPEVWALFALREDYLGALDPYRDDVPTRLSNAFRVDLLTVDDAREAIVNPARDAGREFAPEAAEKLAKELATMSVQQPDGSFAQQTGIYVEPLQLQVVCRRLWDELPPDARTIGVENLLASGDVDAALAAYYDDSVSEIAGADVPTERGLREWFGDRLITPGGIRGQVLREQTESGGLDNESVDRLVGTHLVRSEQRDGKTWLELAHDRLVAPVRESNGAWLEHHLHPMQRQAALWEREGRSKSLLLRGQDLKDARTWARDNESFVRPVERDLLDLSLAQRRAQRRRRWVLVTLVAVFAALTIAALVSQRQAVTSRKHANRAADRANSLLFATPAEASVSTDLDAALLLGLQANRFEGTAPARKAMTLALQRVRSSGLEGIITGSSTYPISSVAFSPDGKLLASGGSDLRLWDFASRKPGPRLPDNVGPGFGNSQEVNPVSNIAFSPDGKKVAAVWSDGTLRVWDLGQGKPAERDLTDPSYGNQEGGLGGLAFSADGNTLAGGDENGKLTFWDLTDRKPIRTHLRRAGDVTDFAFSPRGKTLALVGATGVRLVDLASPKPVPRGLTGTRDVSTIAFSPDGKTLATVGTHGRVRLWNLASPKPRGALLPGEGRARVWTFGFTRNGRTLLSVDSKSKVRAWDVASRRPLALSAVAATGQSAALSPGGTTLATGGGDGKVRLWDLTYGRPLPTPDGKRGSASTVAVSPDGRTLAVGEKGGNVRLWDLASRTPAGPPLTGGGRVPVMGIAFSGDGKTLATGDADGNVRLWDVKSRKPLDTPVATAGRAVSSVAFSPDGKTLATVGSDAKVELWDVRTGKLLATPVVAISDGGGPGSVSSIAFSADGKKLASGGQIYSANSGNNTGAVWVADPRAAKPVDTPVTIDTLGPNGAPPDSSISSVAFSPDGKTLATAENRDFSGKVRLRDVGSPALTGPALTGPAPTGGGEVTSVAFAPDGERLAISYENGTVQLWDIASRTPLGAPLTKGGPAVKGLVFSPDGRTLVGIGAAGNVRLWNPVYWTDDQDLQDQVCALVWRNLTPAQWARDAPADFPYRPVCPD